MICIGAHFPGGPVVKNPPANAGDIRDSGSILGSGRSPGEGKWQPIPVFLPGKSHEHRTLVGYSPLSCKRDRHDLAIKQQQKHVQEKAMGPHSSTLAWKIPWTEEPGRLQSMGPLRVGHDWSDLAEHVRWSVCVCVCVCLCSVVSHSFISCIGRWILYHCTPSR